MPYALWGLIPTVGAAYELHSRNLSVGIWDGMAFHGIRRKFDSEFLDSEIHHALCDRHGTAVAIRRLT